MNAIEVLKEMTAIAAQQRPVTRGPVPGDDTPASSPTPAKPCAVNPRNNCDCAGCGTTDGAP